jgi:hypothetical protein
MNLRRPYSRTSAPTLEIVSKSRKACCYVPPVFPRVTSEDCLYPSVGKGLTGKIRSQVRNTTLRAFVRFDILRRTVRNPLGISSPQTTHLTRLLFCYVRIPAFRSKAYSLTDVSDI